jgi:hypothetical protein
LQYRPFRNTICSRGASRLALDEENNMNSLRSASFALAVAAMAGAAFAAEPEYTTIKMEIDIAKPAKEVWAKVGGYCDISKWLNNVDCKITSGDGGMGTVRVLAGGRVTEILVAQTELSYGYTQPVREGQYYILYHGFMEARPVTATTSKMLYTLMYDVSNLADKAAKDADIARRKGMFETALKNMKALAEGQ